MNGLLLTMVTLFKYSHSHTRISCSPWSAFPILLPTVLGLGSPLFYSQLREMMLCARKRLVSLPPALRCHIQCGICLSVANLCSPMLSSSIHSIAHTTTSFFPRLKVFHGVCAPRFHYLFISSRPGCFFSSLLMNNAVNMGDGPSACGLASSYTWEMVLQHAGLASSYT